MSRSDLSTKPRFSLKDSQVVRSYYRVLQRVTAFFCDPVKAQNWMLTQNGLLGGITPLQMIEAGRTQKLENWIIDQIEENGGPVSVKGFEAK